MARNRISSTKKEEDMYLEALLKNNRNTTKFHHDYKNCKTYFRHKSTQTYFDIALSSEHIILTADNVIEKYKDVIDEISKNHEALCFGKNEYRWNRNPKIANVQIYQPELVPTKLEEIVKEEKKVQPADLATVKNENHEVIKLPKLIKKIKFMPTLNPEHMSLPEYLRFAYNHHPEFIDGGYDAAKHALILRHNITRSVNLFGISADGTKIYFKETEHDLSNPTYRAFVEEVSRRLYVDKPQYLQMDKAITWSIDGLLNKFPELKD